MVRGVGLGVCLALVAGVALAEESASPGLARDRGFQAFEGTSQVKHGEGGTRVTANGVDFWTTGSPPRDYRVLGVLSDTRPATGGGSNAFKSAALAKRIRDAGGDAAIQLDASTSNAGDFRLSGGLTVSGEKRTTRFIVAKYVSAD